LTLGDQRAGGRCGQPASAARDTDDAGPPPTFSM